MSAASDLAIYQAALSHVLGEVKKHDLNERVSYVEISTNHITLNFEGTPPAPKKSSVEEAMERAKEEEDTMYGSAGG
jgi:2'-5' RNA ligase